MEEKEHQIYMLCEILNDKFDQEQWKVITLLSPETFLKRQEIILSKLLIQKKLFQKYFDIFYSNHVKLLNWSVLAVQQKAHIMPYVFKNLVSKGSSFFNRKIKDVFGAKLRKKQQQKEELNLKEIKSMQMEVYKQFFYEMLVRNNNQNQDNYKTNYTYSKSKQKSKRLEPIDGHDFYIKTFNACNGWKYIFYNYEKHMKGLSQKWKYNQKIRGNQQKSLFDRSRKDDLGLLDYEHPEQTKVQVKVLNLSNVLGNSGLNSMQGLKKIVNKTSKGKLCFHNHQGKPITYRVARIL